MNVNNCATVVMGFSNRRRRWLIALVVSSLLAACGGGGGNSNNTPPPTLPTVSVSPAGATYATPITITLTATVDGTIYNTLDCSEPSTGSAVYTGPITIDESMTLRFFAKNAAGSSNIAEEIYVIDQDAPDGHTFTSATQIVDESNEATFQFFISNAETGASFSLLVDDTDDSSDAITRDGDIDATGEQAITVDLTTLVAGVINAELRLTDAVGNVSTRSLQLTKQGPVELHNLTGTIFIAPGTQVDSDVNDISTDVVSNNSFATAQTVAAPGSLGGYVNQPQTGSTGNLRRDGDEDFFLIELEANDQIVMTIGDHNASTNPDLDLELYDSGQVLVADSLGTGNTEVITVPNAGLYYVRVYSFSDASNYVLTVGSGVGSARNSRASLLSTFHRFVTNEALVTMTTGVKGTSEPRAMNWLRSQGMVASDADSSLVQRITIVDDAQRRALIEALNPSLIARSGTHLLSVEENERRETLWAIKALQRRSDIEHAEPNYLRQGNVQPNDLLYEEQWNYPQIRLPETWDVTTGSADVRIAILDTGILSNHPDLQSQIVDGYDMISDSDNARDGDGIDADAEDSGDLGLSDGSSSFHGSHVAGIVAAASNNSIGMAGIAWQSKIMPLRVLGRYGGTSFDLIQAIRYAAGLSNSSDTVPSQPADIINMSLGGGGFSASEADALDAARQAGVVLIAASGNDGRRSSDYPAAYEGVISVGSINQSNELTSYSNYGPELDITAPGGDLNQDADTDGIPDGILSTIGSDREVELLYGYRSYQGTSMAAPHVAGIAALMKSVNADLSPADFDRLLIEGRMTDDLGVGGLDDIFGYGVVNALKAVTSAQALADGTLAPLAPSLSITPNPIDFGLTQHQKMFSIYNSGGGDLTVSKVEKTAQWLTLQPDQVDDNQLGSYLIQADRSSLSVGSYSSRLTVESTAGNSNITVTVRVSADEFFADSGTLFALLIPADTMLEQFQNNLGPADDGAYEVAFNDVPSGGYELFIGSDMDNDDYICDAGEACGAYPTLNEVGLIDLTADDSFSIDVSFDQSRFFGQNTSSSVLTNGAGIRLSPPLKQVK